MKMPKNIRERNGVLYIEIEVKGKRIKKTTGLIGATKENLALAVRVRDKMLREILEGTYELNEQRRAPKGRNCGTVGELFEKYLAICRRQQVPQPYVAKQNVQALMTMFRYLGVDEHDCLRKPVDAINRALVVDYTEAAQKQLGADKLSTGVTVNSAIRKVRSIFKKKIMNELPGDLVPADILGFLNQYSCVNTYKEIKQNRVPPTDEEMRPLIEEAAAMGPRNPLRAVWLLSYHFGMRSGEIQACRWSWFVQEADGSVQLRLIRQTDPETGKKVVKTTRIIPVHPDVWRSLQETKTDGAIYIVAGDNASARYRMVARLFSDWVRRVANWPRRQTSHALRAYRIEKWKQAYGIEIAAVWAGHSDLRTTDGYVDTQSVRRADVAPLAD